MSRKSRRERAAKASSPQNQTPAPQQPAAAQRASRPVGGILVLGVLVLGGIIFAGYYFFIHDPLPVTREPSPGPHPVVVMETSEGPLTIELFEKDSPITVKNFLTYVDEKFYDGTIFHRVIPNFMIQGGGFEPGMRRKDGHPPIRNEAGNGLANRRGTLAMARTNDPDSASSEFFINVVDNLLLDRNQAKDRVGYAVFGRVIEGMEIADRIRYTRTANVKTPEGMHEAVPVQDVIIKSVRRAEPKKDAP
ncbi:MAG TPA: peptidylprolyl isomerase [Gemmataceae bacterium]|nr:peptidylprolyl isomerase [Gemmataceae bacterium]